MTVIKCDRCGKEIRDPNDVFIVEAGFRGYQQICRPDRYDLCKDCAEALPAWLHPDNKEEQK